MNDTRPFVVAPSQNANLPLLDTFKGNRLLLHGNKLITCTPPPLRFAGLQLGVLYRALQRGRRHLHIGEAGRLVIVSNVLLCG